MIEELTYQHGDLFIALQPLQAQHAKFVHEAVLASLDDLLPFMDWAHGELTLERQLERIRKSRDAYSKGTEFDFSAFDIKSGDFLMSATLGRSRVPNRNACTIGYWVSSSYANRGIATLVTKMLTVVAFDHMKCDRVEIGCNSMNKKSLRVIEKCGYILEGEARNYFSAPTSQMIERGYCQDNTCLQFALIPQDLAS